MGLSKCTRWVAVAVAVEQSPSSSSAFCAYFMRKGQKQFGQKLLSPKRTCGCPEWVYKEKTHSIAPRKYYIRWVDIANAFNRDSQLETVYASLSLLFLFPSLFCLDNFFNLFNIPTHFQFTHGALTQHFLFIASGVKSNFLFSLQAIDWWRYSTAATGVCECQCECVCGSVLDQANLRVCMMNYLC